MNYSSFLTLYLCRDFSDIAGDKLQKKLQCMKCYRLKCLRFGAILRNYLNIMICIIWLIFKTQNN